MSTTMMESPVQLVLWASRQPDTYIVTYGHQGGRFGAFLRGGIGVRNIYAPALFKFPWPMYPSLSLSVSWSSSGGKSGGRVKCSSAIWKRSSMDANTSGEAERREELWKEYFANPSQWWDNRADKRNPKSPDFKHKVTREALWVDGCSTPPWVKAMLNLVDGDNLELHVGDSSTRDLRPVVQGSDAGVDMQNASTSGEAFAILKSHLEQGRIVDSKMYVVVLQRCLKERDLVLTKHVHDYIKKNGMEQKAYVVNNLMRVYIRCGRLQDAREIFDKLVKKDVFSWTSMIEGYAKHDHSKDAMEVFNQMLQEGGQPNEFTYSSILKAFSNPRALEWGKVVHAHIRRHGYESDVGVGNALLQMYAKSGSIDDARQVFDIMKHRDVITWTVMIGGLAEHRQGHEAYELFLQMQRQGIVPNVITWNVMIGGLAEHGRGHEAYELFMQMQRQGIVPNAYTYSSILNACASMGALEWVKEVHNHAVKAGYGANLRVGNALVHMYAKCGSIEDARLVFDRMKQRDVITWTMMIGGLAEHGRGHEAYETFLQMQRHGIVPNEYTYVSILNACASAGALEWVKEVHNHALKTGYGANLRVGNALIHMYVKSGSIEDAQIVFDSMVDYDVITWNLMIGGLAAYGRGHEAYQFFLQMQRHGIVPNAYTYVSILNACASVGALEWVKEVHNHALKAELDFDLRVGNALIHMYAKSGSIDNAQLVFEKMVDHDVITWNVIIGGLAQHGRGHEALQLFGIMNAKGVKPDGRSFVAVLLACSHAGLVDEGRCQFLAMTQDYGMDPTLEHYTCMVDLLGRAGHLEEAYVLIRDMTLEPDVVIWGALLGACRIHGNVELGELAFKESLKLDPVHAPTYVLLSNIYAAAGKWDQVALVRTMMQERGIRKEPGCSWIEVDDKIHSFVVGDTSHPKAKEIYAELKRLMRILKAEGYIPDTRFVLHNVDEEDKELALCSHSEKLAIAYGLLCTPSGKPVRVYKNLRVCLDCHTATKFISKVTGREIVARDANRFHHFKDGICSCGDYW